MAAQTYALDAPRIGRFKGQILKRATFKERLAKTGRQIPFPKNSSDTYIARRYLPFGATSTDQNTQNRFIQNGNGDRGNLIVQAHQTAEGITPTPDSIESIDISVVMVQYSCLYGFTDKTFYFYEDDVPKQMIEQIGDRVGLVNEMIIWGALRACTNQYYGGAGTSVATVNGALTLTMIRRIVKNLQANNAQTITSVLSASQKYGTDAVEEGYLVYCHTDMEPDIRDLPGFTPCVEYASGTPMPGEVGKCERFRFITSPNLPSLQNAGAAIGTTGLYSTSLVNIDVYQIIVAAEDAWGQVMVRGLNALDPTFLPPSEKSKSDPHGQRGYAGTIWWKAVMVENGGWMAVANVGVRSLAET